MLQESEESLLSARITDLTDDIDDVTYFIARCAWILGRLQEKPHRGQILLSSDHAEGRSARFRIRAFHNGR